MNKYIILELIPTSLDPARGEIIQLSALKLNNLDLIDRFDYRIIDNKVPLTDLLEMISYDKENFIYKNTTEEILNDFKKWSEDLPLLILDNSYTLNYLKNLDNEKKSILKHLNMEYSDNIIEEIIKKYNLETTNYIVDLLYEAMIYESNNK
jgi:DNA polymerase III alpha subunit (gram-positive type)